MKNKLLISAFLLLTLVTLLYSQVFATNNMMNSAGNAIKNAGNAVKNAATTTKDTIMNGTENLINGAGTLGNDAINGMENIANDMDATPDMATNDDYTAQRTAAPNTGLFRMSNTVSTWIILGIIGAVIVGLVWYYGAQYEHKNYNND